MLANLATLIGLLGTISGLITAFAAAATLDPTDRAQKLSEGIAEAMNCTAYGLLVAIFSLVCFAFLQGKTQSLIDELKETAFEIRSSLPFDESSKKGAA
jgi:biopolymer transport protein ExbB/TolQ